MIINNFKHKIKFNKPTKGRSTTVPTVPTKVREVKKDFYEKFRDILNLILF